MKRGYLQAAVAALIGMAPGAIAPVGVQIMPEPAAVRAPAQTPKQSTTPAPSRGQVRQVLSNGYTGPALTRFLFGPRGDRTDGFRFARNQRERRRDIRRGGKTSRA